MAEGFEAKARIDVDVSQFLSAYRQAVRASGTFSAALRDLTKDLNGMERAARSAAQSLSPFKSTMRTMSGDTRQVADSNRKLSEGLRENAQAFKSTQNAAQGYAQTQAMTAAAVQRLGTSSTDAANGLSRAQRAVGELDGSMFALRSSLSDVESGLQSIASVGQRALTVLAQNFSAQEMATAHLARVTQETDTFVAELADSFRGLSESIPVPFEELAGIGVLGSQVGIANEHLLNFTETVALFAATTDVAERDAALLFARILEMTGIKPENVQNLGAAVSELGSNSAATEQEILTTIESIATVATQAGLSETSILGLGSAMASLRIRPELARGAVQRVLLQMETAATSAGSQMEKLAEITGLTDQELRALAENNTEQFFFTVMEALGGLAEGGENLIPILREIGIMNTRDADVVARLAGNYELLDDSVALANRSFAEGTFLHQESARLFETLTARVQILGNQWSNFLNTVFEAVAPVALKLVEAASSVIEFLDAMASASPGMTAFVVIAGTIVTGLAIMGAAVAAAVRSFVAFRQTMAVLATVQAGYAAASATSTVATAAGTTAAVAQTGALTALTGAAGRAAVALRALALAHPVTAIAALATAVAAAGVAFAAYGASADRQAQSVLKANDANITAAGGLDALRTALQQDTAAWGEATAAAEQSARASGLSASGIARAVQEVSDAAAIRVTTTEDVTEATREEMDATRDAAEGNLFLQEQLHGSAAELRARREELDGDTSAIDRNIAVQEGLSEVIKDNSAAFEEQEVAIGAATRAWAAGVIEASLLETGITKSAEAMDVLRESGVDIGAALNAELDEAGTGAENLRAHAAALRAELPLFEQFLFDAASPLAFMAGESENAARALDTTADSMDAVTLTLQEARDASKLTGNELINFGNGVVFTQQELAELDVTAFGLEQTLFGLEFAVSDLRDGFASFVDPLQAWKDAQDAANQAVIDADNGITVLTENAAVSFDDFIANMEEMQAAQHNWATNLLELADRVPPEVLADLTQMGLEGADLVQELVNKTDTEVDRFVELWNSAGGNVLDDFAIVYADFLAMSQASGDESGRAFVDDLLAQARRGDIDMREVVDQLLEYTETEFDNSDPTVEGELDDAELRQGITDLLRAIEDFQADADDTMISEPGLSTGGFWSALSSFWTSVVNWWGNGPRLNVSPQVSGNFGGSGTFGPLPKKDGGWVSGPGGPREDKIPALLSDDEFVVNARSAREFGPLLEAINRHGGSGASQMLTPNFVPDDIFRMPRRPLDMATRMPSDVARGRDGVRDTMRERIVINVNNTYPRAEPTSTTINRSLQYAATLEGLSA